MMDPRLRVDVYKRQAVHLFVGDVRLQVRDQRHHHKQQHRDLQKVRKRVRRKVADALRRAQRGQNPFHRLLQEPAEEAEVFVFHVRFSLFPRETCGFPAGFQCSTKWGKRKFLSKKLTHTNEKRGGMHERLRILHRKENVK